MLDPLGVFCGASWSVPAGGFLEFHYFQVVGSTKTSVKSPRVPISVLDGFAVNWGRTWLGWRIYLHLIQRADHGIVPFLHVLLCRWPSTCDICKCSFGSWRWSSKIQFALNIKTIHKWNLRGWTIIMLLIYTWESCSYLWPLFTSSQACECMNYFLFDFLLVFSLFFWVIFSHRLLLKQTIHAVD